MNNTLAFYNFIYDRHLIWYKKEVLRQSMPWTEDPVLSKNRFCNVYRYLDRGTQYIVNRVINTNLTPQQKFFNIYIYRIFNLDKLFDGVLWDDILYPETFDFKKEEARLDAHKAAGKTMYSDAYTITQSVWCPDYGKKGKHIQVLLAMDWLAKKINAVVGDFERGNPRQQLEYLREIPMVGPFLAGQIMLDLGYAGITKWKNNDWVVVGPGALAGLEIIFQRDSLKTPEQEALVRKLAFQQPEWFNEILTLTGKDWRTIAFKDHNYPYLSLMDIQNSLCEYRKYVNLNRSLSDSSFRCKHRYYKGIQQ